MYASESDLSVDGESEGVRGLPLNGEGVLDALVRDFDGELVHPL